MSRLTKEWLMEVISGLEDLRDPMLSFLDDDQAKTYDAFKLALASLTAEPAGWQVKKCGGNWVSIKQEDVHHYILNEESPVREVYTAPPAPVVHSDYFASLVSMARLSADKAMCKFPQPNYVLLKVAEEAGEVVQAGVHYAENRLTWDEVEGEIVQLLAMLIRLVTEGDQINGVTPPQSVRSAGVGIKES